MCTNAFRFVVIVLFATIGPLHAEGELSDDSGYLGKHEEPSMPRLSVLPDSVGPLGVGDGLLISLGTMFLAGFSFVVSLRVSKVLGLLALSTGLASLFVLEHYGISVFSPMSPILFDSDFVSNVNNSGRKLIDFFITNLACFAGFIVGMMVGTSRPGAA